MPNSNFYNFSRGRPIPTASSLASIAPTPGPLRPRLVQAWHSVRSVVYHNAGENGHHQMAHFNLKPNPYYPVGSRLNGYVENNQTTSELLVKFGGTSFILLATTWFALKRWRPSLHSVDRTIVLWFVLTGFLHVGFEGYFLWKEYALSDSRYLTIDTFVLSIETITATVWGPLALCTAYMVATSNPLRHCLQMIISLAHIYGCLLYFATATVDSYLKQTDHSRPEVVYYWVYYFGMNFIFIAIPSVLLVQSIAEIQSAFIALERMKRSIRTNGKVPKNEGSVRIGERKKSK